MSWRNFDTGNPELIDSWSDDFTYIHISESFKCSKKADHNLEMAELGLLSEYRFINYICKIRLSLSD